ncbi:MAG: ABC transporter ATP-binding protein [Verrucomicrobiota bacterium]
MNEQEGMALTTRGLTKSFSRFQLGPLDMNVPRGSIYGFVGPNGSGKTTTLDLIYGMGTAEAGEVTLAGLDAFGDEVAAKRKAAYVATDLVYSSWGKVWKAIRFVRGFYPDQWDDDHCLELLKRFGIGTQDRIATLSFGNRTKLALVLALAWKPEVLILDEPSTGLDAIAKQELFGELLDIVSDVERTVLVSSHNLGDVERFADHLGILKDGQMIHEGPTSDIVDRYRMVDVTLAEGAEPKPLPGLTVVERRNGLARLLVDQQQIGIHALPGHGYEMKNQSPVTLEDLFVALLTSNGEEAP